MSFKIFADFFTSKKRELTSSIYYLVIYVFPLVLAKTQAGVSNCTIYLKLVVAPIYPRKAKASGENLIFSVEARIAKIFISSSNP